MDLKAVGLRIKTAREAKGLTQENLADPVFFCVQIEGKMGFWGKQRLYFAQL